jgi:hypothetical protein
MTNQYANEAVFFVNENSQHVLDIFKRVFSINQKLLYSITLDNEEDVFLIFDENGNEHSHFIATYSDIDKEFNLTVNLKIHPFQKHIRSLTYQSKMVFDSRLNYQRTEIYICPRKKEHTLAFVVNKEGIYVSYVEERSIIESYPLVSKKIMSKAFDKEVAYLLDFLINYSSLFDNYTISELFGVRDNPVAINDMKKISEMITI